MRFSSAFSLKVFWCVAFFSTAPEPVRFFSSGVCKPLGSLVLLLTAERGAASGRFHLPHAPLRWTARIAQNRAAAWPAFRPVFPPHLSLPSSKLSLSPVLYFARRSSRVSIILGVVLHCTGCRRPPPSRRVLSVQGAGPDSGGPDRAGRPAPSRQSSPPPSIESFVVADAGIVILCRVRRDDASGNQSAGGARRAVRA